MNEELQFPKPTHGRREPASYYFGAYIMETEEFQTLILQKGFDNYGRELMEWINSKPDMDLPILSAVLRLTREALRNADETMAEAEDDLVNSLDITVIATPEETT